MSVCPIPQASAEQSEKELSSYPATPKGVVQAFLKAGYDVRSVKELGDYGDVEARQKYFLSPHRGSFDCNTVVLGHRIAEVREDANKATVRVIYGGIGALCGAGHPFVLTKKNEEVKYILDKEDGLWKIRGPHHPPFISVRTAIEVSEYHMTIYPERNKALSKNIAILKQYLRK